MLQMLLPPSLSGSSHYNAAAPPSYAHTTCVYTHTQHRYLSALLLSLSTMLHLELPQVNVLSKVDLVPHYGRLGACV